MTKRIPTWGWRLLDAVWLVALVLYALAGYRNVPFHGDEATLIFMSHDYHYLLQAGDLDAVLYTDTPADPSAQELRYINGTIGKMAMGLAWDLAGYTVDDLNEQWAWGAPWDWNITDNHMPADNLLYAARLSSALMLAASVAVLFAIAWIVGHGRWAAYSASLAYVLTPAVLVNGRRAMMEGALLLSTMLVVLAGLAWMRVQARGGTRWWHVAALGVTAGLAISSKHNTAVAVALVFGMCLIGPAAHPHARPWSHAARARVLQLASAGLLAGLVFLLLNPVWWSDPLHMPGRVLDARRTLLEGQQTYYGTYDGAGERLEGLIRRVADGTPQYYEVGIWQRYIKDQIAAYEDHAWTGIDGGVFGAFVRLAGLAIGTGALLARAVRRDPAAWLALAWFWGTALALLVLTPFDWQRYYLPLQPALAVLLGAGLAALVRTRDRESV